MDVVYHNNDVPCSFTRPLQLHVEKYRTLLDDLSWHGTFISKTVTHPLPSSCSTLILLNWNIVQPLEESKSLRALFGIPDISTHLSEYSSRGMCAWSRQPGPGSAASFPALRRLPRCRSCRQRSTPSGPSCDPGCLPSTQPCRWDHQVTSGPGWLRSPAATHTVRSSIYTTFTTFMLARQQY